MRKAVIDLDWVNESILEYERVINDNLVSEELATIYNHLLNPFKVTFTDWHLFVAFVLVLTALIIYRTDIHSKAYKKGLEKGADIMWDMIKSEAERVKKENEKK